MQVSIRELKANPSHAIATAQRGERVQITSHRKVVAELISPAPVMAPVSTLSDDEAMQRLMNSGLVALAATQPMRLGKAIVFPPGPQGQTLSDLVIEQRGLR